jgi:hypothetical protein
MPGLAKMGTVWNPALKRWVGIVGAPEDDVCGVLDLARVADTVLFAVSASAPVTDFGMLCQTTIRALGAASVTYIVTDLDEQPMKRRNDLKKAATHSAHAEFPEAKVRCCGPPCVVSMKHTITRVAFAHSLSPPSWGPRIEPAKLT